MRGMTAKQADLARKISVWVAWRHSPGCEPICLGSHQSEHLAESHMLLDAGVERLKEAEAKGLFLQEWKLPEAFTRNLIDRDRARSFVLLQENAVHPDESALRYELSGPEGEYAKAVPVWEVWYEDRFSHEGNLVDVYLSREEAQSEVDTMGPVDMKSGKFDGLYLTEGKLCDRLHSDRFSPARILALVLCHKAEAELSRRRSQS